MQKAVSSDPSASPTHTFVRCRVENGQRPALTFSSDVDPRWEEALLTRHQILCVDAPLTSASHRFSTQLAYQFCHLRVEDDLGVDLKEGFESLLRLETLQPDQPNLLRLRAVVLADSTWFQPLAPVVHHLYPGMPIFWLQLTTSSRQETGSAQWRVVSGGGPMCRITASCPAAACQLILQILDRHLAKQMSTPFWDALQAHAAKTKANFHGLPIADGRSSTPSVQDFAEFYGDNVFRAETSLSTPPLDSLLLPHASIREAQRLAARGFGARQVTLDGEENFLIPEEDHAGGTRFLTTGTSSANRVVIGAVMQPNDHVLLERNSHISHYQALADAHARPVLLPPFISIDRIPGPTRISAIRSGIRGLLREQHRLPALIILTNPTFSGIFYQPRRVIEAVVEEVLDFWREMRDSPAFEACCRFLEDRHRETEREPQWWQHRDRFLGEALGAMVFLFDEAWGAMSIFHPQLVEYAAMHAAGSLRKQTASYWRHLRVYSTQSTHKCLSAFRQGSMIHFQDLKMNQPRYRMNFESAYRSHTTTSPNASIVASLDVARKQAELDGVAQVDRSIRLATKFLRDHEEQSLYESHYGFNVVDHADLLCCHQNEHLDLSPDEYAADPTKLALTWSFPMSASAMRLRFLEQGIRANKFNHSSMLVFFNIGIESGAVRSLLEGLRAINEVLVSHQASTTESNTASPLAEDEIADICHELNGIYEHHNLGHWRYNLGNCDYACMSLAQARRLLCSQPAGHASPLLSAGFITPYPPGIPLLLPGQPITSRHLDLLEQEIPTETIGVEIIEEQIHLHVFKI